MPAPGRDIVLIPADQDITFPNALSTGPRRRKIDITVQCRNRSRLDDASLTMGLPQHCRSITRSAEFSELIGIANVIICSYECPPRFLRWPEIYNACLPGEPCNN